MSGRFERRPRWASAGGQELQPCEVKSSMAQGPSVAGRAETSRDRPAATAAAPISTDLRPGEEAIDMMDRMRAPALACQSTIGH